MPIDLDGEHLQLTDMDDHNQEDSVSVVNSIVKNEDVEVETRELTATPLKRYVTMVDNGIANKWICNFGCKSEPYTGTYSRIRAHIIGLLPGQKSQGVALCTKVSKEEREKMKKEEDEAKRVFGGCTRRTSVSGVPAVSQAYRTPKVSLDKGKDVSDKQILSSKEEADGSVARFFYGCGIPINVAKSPFWVDMVRAINEAPKGYEPPSSEKIKTSLLDQEKTKVDQALVLIKQQWPTYGVSVVSDGWMNVKNESFIKIMAVSESRAMLISGLDCSRDEVSHEFIAGILLKAVESVGAFNVVQILTDNSPTCKAAGRIIETTYPHIFWTGCVAHTLSLLLKDMVKSMHPCLAFVGNCYNKVKGVTNYLKNHSSSLNIFRMFPELDGFLVKKTRYGQHVLVLERTLRVKNALINMVLSEEWDRLTRGRSKSKMEHDTVRKTILDDDFWKNLRTIVTFMRPIWDLISYCESDRTCIGEVYQRMDDMFGSVKLALPDSADLRGVIQKLVAGRWDKMEILLYSLAYVLSPHYYSHSWLSSLAPGGKKRKKPHADPDVQKVYLDVVDRLVRDSKEASLVRQQLSDFVSSTGSFSSPQAIKDRDIMSALSWWHLYGASAPELYGLAIKVLSQCVKTSCAKRELATCEYILNVKKNKMNTGRAESLVYVHYNHRLLTRNREDYEGLYRNWDSLLTDDNLEVDVEAIEERECAVLHSNEVNSAQSLPFSTTTSAVSSQTSTQGSSKLPAAEIVCSKKRRLR
ncbi:50S ribosomal protein [Actinidia chinensis var. chinensis]|uniref:50S ribosomal protein n=1 Tax=Actinidia chinensis var. chinensis TaxID=1590841 RepID=A0A2R6PET4_ACTCC|nr:50S ribosomal protein [Actinidia chinensis var. chinensis]